MDDYLPTLDPQASGRGDSMYSEPPPPPQEKTKRRRMLSEKQKEALRSGRSRRWSHLAHINQDPYNPQPEPEPLMLPQDEPPQQPKQHPFFDLNSSESSSSEDSEEEEEQKELPPQMGKSSKVKKPRIPNAIKRRVDRYIEAKMREMGGGSRGMSSEAYGRGVALQPRFFQYL